MDGGVSSSVNDSLDLMPSGVFPGANSHGEENFGGYSDEEYAYREEAYDRFVDDGDGLDDLLTVSRWNSFYQARQQYQEAKEQTGVMNEIRFLLERGESREANRMIREFFGVSVGAFQRAL